MKCNSLTARIFCVISDVVVLTFLISCKHDPIYEPVTSQTFATPPDTNQTLNGTILYTNNCAGCHGPLVTSAKIGATTSEIQTGITTISAMNTLSNLSAIQIAAIAHVLDSIPMPTNGTALYGMKCASCHGSLINSQVGGASVSDIQDAIKQKGQMKFLSTLTLAQIDSISSALLILGNN